MNNKTKSTQGAPHAITYLSISLFYLKTTAFFRNCLHCFLGYDTLVELQPKTASELSLKRYKLKILSIP